MKKDSYYKDKTNKGQILVKSDEERKENAPKYVVDLNVGGEMYELPLWQNDKVWGDKSISIDLEKCRPLLAALVREMLDTSDKSSNTTKSCTQDVVPKDTTDDSFDDDIPF